MKPVSWLGRGSILTLLRMPIERLANEAICPKGRGMETGYI